MRKLFPFDGEKNFAAFIIDPISRATLCGRGEKKKQLKIGANIAEKVNKIQFKYLEISI